MDKDKKLLKQLWDKMSVQEQAFVKIFLETSDKRIAYRDAMKRDDLDNVAGYRYAERPKIKAYLEAVGDKIIKDTTISAEWIIGELKENSNMAKESGKLSDSNRALELLGKNLSMFTDSVTVKGIDELVSKLQDKGDALADQVDE